MADADLGKYRLLATLGRGGMADVYLAVARGPAGFTKLLVLKELRDELAKEPEFFAMFLDEARLAARLRHPNVVQSHEVGEHDGRPYIAMEYLDGQPFSRVLTRATQGHGMPLRLQLRVLAEMLSGLDYAHELVDFDGQPMRIVHRDVTPHNVFLTYDGEVKLVDFGIAKAASSSNVTRTGILKGKAGYMAPEQALADDVDRRADVFSAGVMLWEAATGRRMWRGLSDVAIIGQLLNGRVPAPRAATPDLDPALERIIERATAPEPDHRFPDAAALRQAIEEYAATLGPVPSSRELGAFVSQLFADERERVRALLETQMGTHAAAVLPVLGSAQLPSLRESTMSGSSPTGTARFGMEPTPSSSSLGSARTLVDENGRLARTNEPSTVPPPAHGRRRNQRLLMGASALAAALAVGALALAVRPERAPEPIAKRAPAREPMTPAGDCSSESKPLVELSGDIEADAVLTCDKDYLLKFRASVLPGVTLSIQKGTTIRGDVATKGTLVVQPGAKIHARGSVDSPIVFTSSRPPPERRPGDWGGVILLGKAPINLRDESGKPTRGRVEGLATNGGYGGNEPDDDSGILSYVRIEYSGTELGPGNEINGLTLAGVGRRTTIDHVQVRHTADDCFEFFGGTVDAKYLVCQYNGDDGFDWDFGFRGRLQFLVLQQDPGVADDTHGFEGDNDPGASTNTPVSEPTIFNATLCGKNVDVPKEQYGILLRRGTRAHIANTIVMGFDAGLDVRDKNTLVDVSSSLFFGNRFGLAHSELPGAAQEKDDDEGLDEIALLRTPARRNLEVDPKIRGCFDAVKPDFAPGSALREGATKPPSDGFFDDTASYLGAVRDGSDRWTTEPWLVWSAR